MFYGGEKGGVFLWLLVTGVKYKGKGIKKFSWQNTKSST